ncbi:MAG TPA: fibrobacter succinogenes major paralogous domain-containing protein [Bacteroidia bacterium]|jgi:uncharacterized protein (TIGR02145 family)|nr:fibrobacter succinogenes major paralogous domain-containing protein [Bacteroidia bacterium]HQF27194.1 fibrobacter succinogenes major paralogous domain-containing protein [Bacteroidia bacterium]HQK96536.1 fibrobacter succinogenes major paralogous domain-containing protein [Bacteroidia bacterium]
MKKIKYMNEELNSFIYKFISSLKLLTVIIIQPSIMKVSFKSKVLVLALIAVAFVNYAELKPRKISQIANNNSHMDVGSEDSIPGTIKDIEGNVYKTVVIGKQVWMQENLRTRTYRNGKPIAKKLSNAQWKANKTGACAVYNNDSIKEQAFGQLYNWYAVANPAGLCPVGWHVAKDTDWNKLVAYLDSYADTTELKRIQSEIAGGAMKEVGITHWASPNTGATGTANFLGFSGGNKSPDGKCNDVGAYGYWWTATPSSTNEAYGRLLSYFNSNIDRFKTSKNVGFSVRCVKNK